MESNHPIHIHDLYATMTYPDIDSIEHSEFHLDSKRVDLTEHIVFTIDPEGSTDADDAFSIIENTDMPNTYYVYNHIADPTAYFNPHDEIFESIMRNGVSQYPTLIPAKHMFHEKIVKECSLVDGVKPAITIRFEVIDCECVDIKCMLTYINCKPECRLTYAQAGSILANPYHPYHETINRIKCITDCMRSNRKDMSEDEYETVIQNTPARIHKITVTGEILYEIPTLEMTWAMKLIEELAIQTNAAVACILYTEGGDNFLKKECDSLMECYGETYSHTGELLFDIIVNKITSAYTTRDKSHLILNLKSYTHFTSPLRRFSDCITHFILKNVLFVDNPTNIFTRRQLNQYARVCNMATKLHKRSSFMDTKYRMYQYIHRELEKGNTPVILEYTHSGYIGGFVNAIIKKMDGMNIHASYTNLAVLEDPISYSRFKGISFIIPITICNLRAQKHDTGILPELDNALHIGVNEE